MTSNEILKADILDILFDNRNKAYGAYMLRKQSGGRLLLSLFLTLVLSFLLIKLVTGGKQTAPVYEIPKDEVRIVSVSMPEPEKQQQRQQSSSAGAARRVSAAPVAGRIVLTSNPVTIDPVDLMAGLSDPGPAVGSGEAPFGGGGSGTGPGTGEPATAAPTEPEVLVQQEPEFPGGIQAWLKFLNRNLTVPGELEAGEKKTVHIRFLVAADGSVTSFEIVRSAGAQYDSEVIRVLKKMPKWKPAIRNGQPAASAFTQPVTFMGIE
ncbi:MAG TPA: energy transducer TonB [Flavisolibacter sp.]|nr:energy transducer TonB [Flavisolibacter sp.]